MAATEYDNIIRQCLAVFERIEDQGENFARDEAFEIVDKLLNDHSLMSQREATILAADLSRSAFAFELDDDAMNNRNAYASFVEPK